MREGWFALQARIYRNTLLNALPSDVIKRLALKPVEFKVNHEIEFPGSTVDRLYFLETGMASMTNTFRDGSQVEVCMFGFESVVGVSALMGTRRSLNRVYTQIGGDGYFCTLEAARAEFELGELFHDLTLRYVQAQLLQAFQSAGCNAKHGLEQRLAGWLLLCADRANCDTFRIKHEFLADMLGSSRPSVSLTAHLFKEAGWITYVRGNLRILDHGGLLKRSCECYTIIKDHLDNYAEFDATSRSEDRMPIGSPAPQHHSPAGLSA